MQRAGVISEFFDGRRMCNIQPLEVERLKSRLRKTETKYGRNVRGGITYHDLRRTFATKLRAAAVHEYDIADLLGHSTTPAERRDTKVTRGYSHAVPSRLREAVESVCTLNVVEFRRKQA